MVLRATLASIQKRLNCFKEKWSHLRRRCLDSTLDTWMSHNKCKFHQERNIWGYFAREIKYLEGYHRQHSFCINWESSQIVPHPGQHLKCMVKFWWCINCHKKLMLNVYLLGSAHEIVTVIGLQTKIDELHEYQGMLQSSSFKADRLLMWTFSLISSYAINRKNSKRILVHPRSTGPCYQDELIPWSQSSPAQLWQSSTAARLHISGHCIAILVTQEMQNEKLTNTSWFVSFSWRRAMKKRLVVASFSRDTSTLVMVAFGKSFATSWESGSDFHVWNQPTGFDQRKILQIWQLT